MKIQIQTVHFNADQKLIEFIDKKVKKLETFHDKILNLDVILSLENLSTQVKEKVVVLKSHVPGNVLVSRETSDIFEESLDLAVASMRKQLEKHKTDRKSVV